MHYTMLNSMKISPIWMYIDPDVPVYTEMAEKEGRFTHCSRNRKLKAICGSRCYDLTSAKLLLESEI